MNSTSKYALPQSGSRRGLLVAFEGIDGSGKTTVAKACVSRLAVAGYDAVLSKEPTDGPIGQEIRRSFTLPGPRDANIELQLFLRDRTWHVQNFIAPVLLRGGIVCLDRYYVSSMAYQGALGLDMESIRNANEAIAPAPDLILLFDLPVSEARQRIELSRPGGANEFEDTAYQEKVQQNFHLMNFPQMVKLDALKPLPELENLAYSLILKQLLTP